MYQGPQMYGNITFPPYTPSSFHSNGSHGSIERQTSNAHTTGVHSPAEIQVSTPISQRDYLVSLNRVGRSTSNGSTFSSTHMSRGSLIVPETPQYFSPDNFLHAQRKQRDANVQKSGGQKVLMLSHCWRNPSLQATKRKLISMLGLNGWSFWADFLDLQATGPVPWRREIEDGIRDCAKAVLFVDREYLLSFNCLQEVAFAVEFSKPIVVVMLEQEAMELLTQPTGADAAWVQLMAFEGKPLTPNTANPNHLSLPKLREIFELLAGINVCMCRPSDFMHDSDRVVLQRLHDFVSAELAYQKEHAQLQSKALEWDRAGRDRSRLPHKSAVLEYEIWLKTAKERGNRPEPTELQELYVKHGRWRFARHRRVWQAVIVGTFMVVGVLAVAAGILWVQAEGAKAESEGNLRKAEANAEKARANEQRAMEAEAQAYAQLRALSESQRLEATARASAEEEARVATARQYLFIAEGDDLLNGFGQAAAREAVALAPWLPAAARIEVWEAAATLGRVLLGGLHVYQKKAVATVQTSYPCTAVDPVSPDGRWAVCEDEFSPLNLRLIDVEAGGVHAAQVPGFDHQAAFDVLDLFWESEGLLVLANNRRGPTGAVWRVPLPASRSTADTLLEAEVVLEFDFAGVDLPQHASSAPTNDNGEVTFGGLFRAEGSEVVLGLRDDGAWHAVAVDVASGSMAVQHSEGGGGFSEAGLAVAIEHGWFVEAFENGTLRVWDLSRPGPLARPSVLPTGSLTSLFQTSRTLCGVSVAPDGEHYAGVLCDTGILGVYHGAVLLALVSTGGRPAPHSPARISWSASSSQVAVSTDEQRRNAILFIDTLLGTQAAVLVGPRTDFLWGAADQVLLFEHEDRFNFSAGSTATTSVAEYRLEGADALGASTVANDVDALRWSHAGAAVLLVDTLGGIAVYDLAGERTAQFPGTFISTSWSFDDAFIVASERDLGWLPGDTNGSATVLLSVEDGSVRRLEHGISRPVALATAAPASPRIAWLGAGFDSDAMRLGVWSYTADGESFRESEPTDPVTLAVSGPQWTAGETHVVVLGAAWNVSGRAEDPFPAWLVSMRVEDGRVGLAYLGRDKSTPGLLVASSDAPLLFLAGGTGMGLAEMNAAGEWEYEEKATYKEGEHIVSAAWAPGGERLFTASFEGVVRENDIRGWKLGAGESACATSWVLAPSLRGQPSVFGMDVRPAQAGDEGQGLRVLVAEGRGFRVVRDLAGYVEVIERQSRGVDREKLDATYRIDRNQSQVAVCLQRWESASEDVT